nr:DUF493 family protein [Candidatus Pandoraea novymonadis]
MKSVDQKSKPLLEFPADFPIKIMGRMHADFAKTIIGLLEAFNAEFDPKCVEMRSSRAGNYIGLTVTIRAFSQSHLDDIYSCLSRHPMVLVVL